MYPDVGAEDRYLSVESYLGDNRLDVIAKLLPVAGREGPGGTACASDVIHYFPNLAPIGLVSRVEAR